MSLFPRKLITWNGHCPAPLQEKLVPWEQTERMSDVLLEEVCWEDVKIQTYEEDVRVRLHSRQTTSPL